MYKKIFNLNAINKIRIGYGLHIKVFSYNFNKLHFTNIRGINKKISFIKTNINNKVQDKDSIPENNKSIDNDSVKSSSESYEINQINNNLYLQIFSCLDKLNAFNDTESEVKKNINRILEKSNIDFKINDEEIMKLVTFKNTSVESSNDENIPEEKLNELLSYLEKIVQEEISEEEFAEDNNNNIRFIRPPHNTEELKKVFKEADKIYEENKRVLFFNDNTIKNEIKDNFVEKIPNCFLMRSLNYPPTSSEIFLIGVQRNSNIHALYLSNVLENYQPDMIAVHMSPDLPLFLNSNSDYNQDWKRLITKKDNFKFLINPLPKSVNEVIITPHKIDKMINTNFAMSSDISISPKIVFSAQRVLQVRTHINNYADALLTPFIHSFNSRTDAFCPIAICDMPLLKILEDIVFSTKINTLKDILEKVKNELGLHNYSFSMEEFNSHVFLRGNMRRLDYTAELIRHLCHSSKRVVCVMNYHYVDTMVEAWQNMGSKNSTLQSFYRNNVEEIDFLDYMEKMVIVDILTGSFINTNFIKCGTFPYAPKEIKSWHEMWNNILNIWMHFYNHYASIIADIPFNQDIYNQFLEKFTLGFEKEVDQQEEQREFNEELLNELNQ